MKSVYHKTYQTGRPIAKFIEKSGCTPTSYTFKKMIVIWVVLCFLHCRGDHWSSVKGVCYYTMPLPSVTGSTNIAHLGGKKVNRAKDRAITAKTLR